MFRKFALFFYKSLFLQRRLNALEKELNTLTDLLEARCALDDWRDEKAASYFNAAAQANGEKSAEYAHIKKLAENRASSEAARALWQDALKNHAEEIDRHIVPLIPEFIKAKPAHWKVLEKEAPHLVARMRNKNK